MNMPADTADSAFDAAAPPHRYAASFRPADFQLTMARNANIAGNIRRGSAGAPRRHAAAKYQPPSADAPKRAENTAVTIIFGR